MMRSGTMWLQRMVSCHPGIVDIPTETHLFEWLGSFAGHFQHATAGSPHVGAVFMERDTYVAAMRSLCDTIFSGYFDALGGTSELLLERTPQHALHLELMGTIYPDAFYLHIIRDGRDVVRSIVNQHFGPDTIPEAARMWRDTVRAARRAGQGLANHVEIRYEELLADPGTHIEALYRRLGLAPTKEAVAAALDEGAVPFNVDPDFPEPTVGKWASEWSARQETACLREAGDLLAELGYVRSPGPGVRRSALARARRRLARRRHDTLARFHRVLMETQNSMAEVVEKLLEAIELGRLDDVDDFLANNALIKAWRDGEGWEGRGPAARERLLALLAEDVPIRGPHVRTEVHTAVPTVVCVSEYCSPDGGLHSRVLAATIEGASLTQLSYYVLSR
jgi:hypothetical protein